MIFSACKTTMEIEETKIQYTRSQSEIKKVDWNLIFEDNTKNQKRPIRRFDFSRKHTGTLDFGLFFEKQYLDNHELDYSLILSQMKSFIIGRITPLLCTHLCMNIL